MCLGDAFLAIISNYNVGTMLSLYFNLEDILEFIDSLFTLSSSLFFLKACKNEGLSYLGEKYYLNLPYFFCYLGELIYDLSLS